MGERARDANHSVLTGAARRAAGRVAGPGCSRTSERLSTGGKDAIASGPAGRRPGPELLAGSLLGSVVVEQVERRLGRARLLFVAVLLSGLTLVTPGLTANPYIVGAAFALSGLGAVMWNVVTVSLRQRIVPDRLLGRLNASYRLLAWGSQPVGALLGGAVGEVFGLPAVFIACGLGTALLLVAFRSVTDRAIEAAEVTEAAPARGGQPA